MQAPAPRQGLVAQAVITAGRAQMLIGPVPALALHLIVEATRPLTASPAVRALLTALPNDVLLDIVVDDDRAEACIDAITRAARTGNIGDGKVFVSDVQKVIRIRTGEQDSDAV